MYNNLVEKCNEMDNYIKDTATWFGKKDAYIKILEEDKDELDKWVKTLRKRLNEKKDYESLIIQPQVSINDIKNTLKFADKIVITSLINYLQADSIEFIKNVTKTLNKENCSEVTQYITGALDRNIALVNMLSEFKDKKASFTDKFTWEKKNITKK